MILGQLKLFGMFLCAGLLVGLCSELGNFIRYLTHDKYFVRFVCDLVATAGAGVVFLYLSAIYSFGLIRLYLLLSFTIGLMLERLTAGKLFALCFKKIYNASVKWWNVIRKSKLFSPIFK
ncbi:MAG: hypothetical protein IK070_02985 [Clostridia bacterium]|nr:hypothetical protein [Clostridia bacterium]